MPPHDANDLRLKRLRAWRTRPEGDASLGGFLKKQFKHDVERPYKQLCAIAAVWTRLLPPELERHTRLEGLTRGVLKVAVDSSPRLYELDRLLRSGLERTLITAHRGPAVRRIQLRVAGTDDVPRASTPAVAQPPSGSKEGIDGLSDADQER